MGPRCQGSARRKGELDLTLPRTLGFGIITSVKERIIPSQEAPLRLGILRNSKGNAPQTPVRNGHLNDADSHKYAQVAATSPTLHGANGPRHPVNVLRRKPDRRQRAVEGWKVKYAPLAATGIAPNGDDEVQRTATVLRRKANRRQSAWWKAIHRAKLEGVSTRKLEGVSTRRTAWNLGMSRNTARKYLVAETVEMVGAVVRADKRSDLLETGSLSAISMSPSFVR